MTDVRTDRPSDSLWVDGVDVPVWVSPDGRLDPSWATPCLVVTIPDGLGSEGWLDRLVTECATRRRNVGASLVGPDGLIAHAASTAPGAAMRAFGGGCRADDVLVTTDRTGVRLLAPHAQWIESPGSLAAAGVADEVIGDFLGSVVAVATDAIAEATITNSQGRVEIADAVPDAVLVVGSSGEPSRDSSILTRLSEGRHVVWFRRTSDGAALDLRSDRVFGLDTGEHEADALAGAFGVEAIVHLDDELLADGAAVQHLLRARPGAPWAILEDRCRPHLVDRCGDTVDDDSVVRWVAEAVTETDTTSAIAAIEPVEVRSGVTSIVIPVHGLWALTERCIESIHANTGVDIEIIVVDDASPDDTASELTARADVVVVSNPVNLGFPKSVNQGIRAATGEFVCVLNNDTEVTPGWLAEMAAVLDLDATLLVGPRSNQISGLQTVNDAPPLAERELAHEWATAWSGARAGSSWTTHRLVGFCLLARRATFEEHGGFDEGFGRGNFEDDELCQRLRSAGGVLRVADGSVVLHHGSATFRSLDEDYVATLAGAARHHRPSPSATASAITGLVLCDGDTDAAARTVVSMLGLGHRFRVVERGGADTLALALGRTLRLGVEVVQADWMTSEGAATALDGLDGGIVVMLSAGELLEVREWGAARAELEQVDGDAAGLLVSGVPETRAHRLTPAFMDEIGCPSVDAVANLRVRGVAVSDDTAPAHDTGSAHDIGSAHDTGSAHDIGSAHDLEEPLPPLSVVVAVLSDGDLDAAAITVASVAGLTDAVMVLDPSTDEQSVESLEGAAVIGIDWTAENAIAELLEQLDMSHVLVLGAGERLVVDEAGWAADLCLLDRRPVAITIGDVDEVRLAACGRSALDHIGAEPTSASASSAGLRIVPADLDHAEIIAARFPELASPSSLELAAAGDPSMAEKLAETMTLDEELRRLEHIRAERPIDWGPVGDVSVGVAIAHDPTSADDWARLMDTLISLRRQTHAPVDVVIVTPPGPSNGTGWIPDEVGDEVRLVEHFGLEPGDPSSARAARLANLAATVVEGEWIAVVDAGDVLREDHLSHLLEVAIADRSEIVHAVVASVNGDGVSVEMAGDRQTRTGRLGPLLMHGEMRAFTLRPDAHLIAEQPSANRSARLRLIGVIESVAENVTATRPLAALTTATDHVVRPRDAESTAMSPSASGSVLGTRLHLGCGPNLLEGWVNIDLEEEYGPDLVHDLSMGLPFDDESVDLVHSEHFFEHLSLPDGYSLMQECHRVLRPGGRVRIAMPDLRSTVEAYLGDWRDQAWVDAFPQLDTAARMLNMGLREWGHQYVYDIEDLTLRLESLGFSAVVPQSWGRSEIVELDGLETRPDSLLIVEAIR